MIIIKYAYVPKPVKKESNLVNEAIKFPKIILIVPEKQEDGSFKDVNKGETTPAHGLDIAYKMDLDLVCVSPNAPVPVCKVTNYSKFKYDKEKKEKEALKNQKIVEIKEIQLSPVIAGHDFETKLNQGRKFLEHGDKVKVTLRIKRRYISMIDASLKIVQDYVDKCADLSQVEKKIENDGKCIQVTISPLKKKK